MTVSPKCQHMIFITRPLCSVKEPNQGERILMTIDCNAKWPDTTSNSSSIVVNAKWPDNDDRRGNEDRSGNGDQSDKDEQSVERKQTSQIGLSDRRWKVYIFGIFWGGPISFYETRQSSIFCALYWRLHPSDWIIAMYLTTKIFALLPSDLNDKCNLCGSIMHKDHPES